MPSVGKPIPHESAVLHVTGAPAFLEDATPWADELYVGFVGSPTAAGTLTSIELDEARRMDGVAGLYTAADVSGRNRFGPLLHDEPFLAERELLYVGQPVVVVAAESPRALEQARRAVRIHARDAEPILSIDRAIEMERVRRGSPDRLARTRR